MNAPVIKAERCSEGVWDLTVECPYCGKLHHHDGGSGEAPYYGHRLAHCQNGSRGGYELIPPEVQK